MSWVCSEYYYSAPEVIFKKDVTNTAPNLLSTAADLLKLDQMLVDGAKDASRRRKVQEAADEAFAQQMQEEERKKSQTSEAASANQLPEVDRQMHCLRKDAANLMEVNAAQQHQIQQNQFNLRAAKAQIDHLQKH